MTGQNTQIEPSNVFALPREGHFSGHDLSVPYDFLDSASESTGRMHKDKGAKKYKNKDHDGGRKPIIARNPRQADYIRAFRSCDLTIATGPAGTGKTYLACAVASEAYASGRVKRIIVTRPAVDAGEKLGFFPGTQEDKLAPYLRPIRDELEEIWGAKEVTKLMNTGEIEIAPIATMRGRTLKNAAILGDEMQNATHAQIKMFLTRLGEGSIMCVSGDPDQNDLEPGKSGLADLVMLLEKVKDPRIAIVRFEDGDIVRHPLLTKIVPALSGYGAARPACG